MKELIALYRARLVQDHHEAHNQYEYHPALRRDRCCQLDHVLWMLDAMDQMQDARKHQRWLGFIQGVLYAQGIYDLTELRNQTRKALACE